MLRRLFFCGTLFALIHASAFADETTNAEQRQDLLDLASGAVVLSESTEYGSAWLSLLLLDGSNAKGWASAKNAPFPHSIVIELPYTTQLRSIAFDNTGTEESSYPGISARKIEIQISTTGPDSGFSKTHEVEVIQGSRGEFPLPTGTKARWLKLLIHSNWGDPTYTELMELEAYGTPIEPKESLPPLSGVYDTNYNLMLFKQEGTRVTGCYDWDGGTLTGSTDGRVVQFEWRENQGTQVGTAIMVLSAAGDQISGLWYEGGVYRGDWKGPRAEKGKRPQCTVRGSTAIAEAIAESGRAIVYGIRFATNSDELEANSEPVLKEVLGLLQAKPELCLTVEGHTDSTSSEEYNVDLSKRRAEAVIVWLGEHGAQRASLQAAGLGESQPVADNATAQGRALNRRVEIARSECSEAE